MSKRLSLFAVLLVAMALLVLPAAASIKFIFAGDTVFVGESGLDITNATGANFLAFWESGQNPEVEDPVKTIELTSALRQDFYVSPGDFQDRLGNWYGWDGSNRTLAFHVDDASLSIKLFDGTTDITDKSVIRDTNIDFRIDNNLYPINSRDNFSSSDGFLTIKVRDSTGTVLTTLINATGGITQLVNIPREANVMTSLWTLNDAWDTGVEEAAGTFKYKAGSYDIWIETNANKMKDNLGSITGKTVSKTVTLTIKDDDISITPNTDTVVRGNDFSVALDGQPSGYYCLWIEGTSGMQDSAPKIKAEGAGVNVTTSECDSQIDGDAGDDQWARVQLDSSGKRTVGFSTSADTDDQSYTIRVEKRGDADINDETTVKVVKGAVTIDAEGTKVYYIGEEITLFGENTDSDTVYLFITGPNLDADGVKLTDTSEGVDCADRDENGDVIDYFPGSFDSEAVKSDDTWEMDWNTGGNNVDLDAGTYTIYAVSQPECKGDVSEAEFSTVSVQLKKPFVNASLPSTIIAKGDDINIIGTAEGDPSQGLLLWVLGTNKKFVDRIDVDDDTTFDYEDLNTDDWAAGEYFVVVQHPMYNDELDVFPSDDETDCATDFDLNGDFVCNRISGEVEFDLADLMGSDAAAALTDVLDQSTIDDTYQRLYFVLEEVKITIEPISDKVVGAVFTIEGTTNLAADNDFLVTVQSASFVPTDKGTSGEFSGVSKPTKVVQGTGGVNTWSVEVDTAGWKIDQYIVKVESLKVGNTATTSFFISEVPPTTVPTTAPPTTVPPKTVPPTTVPPTTVPPTTTPGFGAVIALIGLGAVAVLVLRRH